MSSTNQAKLANDPADQKLMTKVLPHRQGASDEASSLGLRANKCNEFMGPFDPSLPTALQVTTGGDGLSLSGFVW